MCCHEIPSSFMTDFPLVRSMYFFHCCHLRRLPWHRLHILCTALVTCGVQYLGHSVTQMRGVEWWKSVGHNRVLLSSERDNSSRFWFGKWDNITKIPNLHYGGSTWLPCKHCSLTKLFIWKTTAAAHPVPFRSTYFLAYERNFLSAIVHEDEVNRL